MSNPQYNPYGGQQPVYPQSGQLPSQPMYPPSGQLPQQPIYPQSGQLPPQPVYSQPLYSQPLYAQPMVTPVMVAPVMMGPQTETNGMAIASLICSLIGIFTADFLVVPGILAVIFGHIALSQIKHSNGRQTGQGMAIAGLIIGYLQVAAVVGYCLFWLFLIMSIGAAGSSGG